MAEGSSDTPTQVATRIFEALNAHDAEAVSRNFHTDVVEDFVAVGRFRGIGPARSFVSELLGAFPDFAIEVVQMVAGDTEHVVVQWRATGTFSGTPFRGVHPTGRPVELRGCDVMQVQDGRLRTTTVYYDGLGFARQIGMLPREGSPADKAMTAAFNAGIDVWARIRKPTAEGSG